MRKNLALLSTLAVFVILGACSRPGNVPEEGPSGSGSPEGLADPTQVLPTSTGAATEPPPTATQKVLEVEIPDPAWVAYDL